MSARLLSNVRLSPAARYLFCLAIIAFATLIRALLNPILKTELPYIGLYFAIMLVGWFGGLGPAILGLILGILSADYLFMPPQHAWTPITSPFAVATTALFVVIGLTTGAMSEVYARALVRATAAYKLSQSRQLELEQIYASAPVGLAFLDQGLRYLRVNDTLAEFNGVPVTDHIGKHISEVLSRPTVEVLTPLLERVLTTRNPLTDVELEGAAAPGSSEMRVVKVSFYPVEIDKFRGVHAVVEDITAEKKAKEELKSLEHQLQHAVKMEAIGRLAGGVAHDFNNLLMVISSYTELLLLQLEGDAGVAKKLNAIAGATQRAARLTKQLLAFSRKQTLQPQVLELDSLIHNSELLLRKVLREDIDFILELNSGKCKVKIDPAQFEQALINLTSNSRDAMDGKGRLVIHTTCRHYKDESVRRLFSLPPGEYVEMSITDSGRGMSPEVQARIFDPFFTTKEPGQGSGLGLATVYGIVKQSGGYIEVTSEVDRGTTFRIWLPTVEKHVEQPVQESQSPLRMGATILLVEDEAILRQAISESLSALGYRVLEASDGVRALEMANEKGTSIDLVLSDAVMPRMGGAELIQSLRQTHPGVKAILMSGYTHVHSVSTATSDEPGTETVFLQKPFAHAELAKMIRKLLSNSLRA